MTVVKVVNGKTVSIEKTSLSLKVLMNRFTVLDFYKIKRISSRRAKDGGIKNVMVLVSGTKEIGLLYRDEEA